MIVVGVEADSDHIECLGAVGIGHRYGRRFYLSVHVRHGLPGGMLRLRYAVPSVDTKFLFMPKVASGPTRRDPVILLIIFGAYRLEATPRRLPMIEGDPSNEDLRC